MNIFKRCTQQPPEPSLWEDDVTVDNILSKLLFYFGGFQCLIEAKKDIETKCEMEKKENYWSESDIKKAWRERERMNKKKKSAIKHWSRVIVLEELKRRLYDDKCKRQAEADVKEDEKTQACGNALRKIGKTDEISFNTEPSIVSEDRQIDNDYKKTRNNEEQVGMNLPPTKRKLNADPSSNQIGIPLSYMSVNESSIVRRDDYNQSFRSPYKLVQGYPKFTNGEDSKHEIRKKKSYVMSYNNKTNNANWVYEILNTSTLAYNEECLKFKSGYQRGHLAAAANHRWCFEAYADASLFTNMAPQIKKLNQGMWKTLERDCRKIVLQPSKLNNILGTDITLNRKVRKVRNVHVYTGPCYSSGNHEDQKDIKALPAKFFKVIILEDENGEVDTPKCYLIPNNTSEIIGKKYTNFECGISDIQSESGLTFLKDCGKLGTPSIHEIKWEGKKWETVENGGNDGSYTAKIEVRIF